MTQGAGSGNPPFAALLTFVLRGSALSQPEYFPFEFGSDSLRDHLCLGLGLVSLPAFETDFPTVAESRWFKERRGVPRGMGLPPPQSCQTGKPAKHGWLWRLRRGELSGPGLFLFPLRHGLVREPHRSRRGESAGCRPPGKRHPGFPETFWERAERLCGKIPGRRLCGQHQSAASGPEPQHAWGAGRCVPEWRGFASHACSLPFPSIGRQGLLTPRKNQYPKKAVLKIDKTVPFVAAFRPALTNWRASPTGRPQFRKQINGAQKYTEKVGISGHCDASSGVLINSSHRSGAAAINPPLTTTEGALLCRCTPLHPPCAHSCSVCGTHTLPSPALPSSDWAVPVPALCSQGTAV